jgi:hypothetical protein
VTLDDNLDTNLVEYFELSLVEVGNLDINLEG